MTTASGGVGDPGGVPQIYGAHFEGLSVVFAADYQGSDRGNHRSARPLSFGGIPQKSRQKQRKILQSVDENPNVYSVSDCVIVTAFA